MMPPPRDPRPLLRTAREEADDALAELDRGEFETPESRVVELSLRKNVLMVERKPRDVTILLSDYNVDEAVGHARLSEDDKGEKYTLTEIT
jgi:hypothetical protein